MLTALEGMVAFLSRIQTNPNMSSELLKAVVGLLGDLAQTFGKRISHIFRMPFVSSLIQQGTHDEDAQEISEWAGSVISAAV